MELIVETSLLDDVKLKDDITEAQETAEEAYSTATKAVSIAGNNDQYFWHTQTGTDTGAHITFVSQETFKANPRGANLLARNNGIAIRDGLLEVAVFNQGGTFYNAYVNNQWQQVAAYTPTYMQIGATVSGKYNVRIDASGTAANNGFFVRNGTTNLSKWTSGSIVFYDGTANQYELAKFDTSGLTLKNSNNVTTFIAGNNGMVLYNNNSYPFLSVDSNGFKLYSGDSYNALISSLTDSSGRVGAYNEDATFYIGTGSVFDLEEIMRADFPTELGAASGYFGGKFARFNTPSNGYSGNYGGGIKIQSKFSHGTAPYGGYGDAYLMLFSGGGTEDIPSANILLKSDFNYSGDTYSSSIALYKGKIYCHGVGNSTGTVYNVQINSDGLLTHTSSSSKYKKDITLLVAEELNPELLYNLPVSQFRYTKQEKGDIRYNKLIPGFIAEDVARIYPIAACFNGDEVEDWEIRHIVPPMLKLIQKQHTEIESLNKRIIILENRIKGE